MHDCISICYSGMRGSFLLIFFILVLCPSYLAIDHHRHHRVHQGVDPRMPDGTRFANRTIYGAMILTDPQVAEVLGRDFHRVPQGVNGTARNNAEWRIENGKRTVAELPFKVDFWLSLHAPACPNQRNKGNDRGVTLSHYQVWDDFVKQGIRYPELVSDDDILVMLEDDAVVAISNVKEVLEKEFSNMNTDHLFLGWCYGRRFMPMCTHAYAITRKLAKLLVVNFDTCMSTAIDAQLKQFADKKMFTWRKPLPESLKNLKPGFEDNPNYFTRGIFIQRNGLVSFNHHGFQNNAG